MEKGPPNAAPPSEFRSRGMGSLCEALSIVGLLRPPPPSPREHTAASPVTPRPLYIMGISPFHGSRCSIHGDPEKYGSLFLLKPRMDGGGWL